jgi:energy-coupling factor transporter ATP-binding protein EcfA2
LWPTIRRAGLDVGAIETVRKTLLEQQQAGTAVLFISEDLEELLTVSDRIAVLHGGEIMGIVDPATVTLDDLGLMMAGEKKRDPFYLKLEKRLEYSRNGRFLVPIVSILLALLFGAFCWFWSGPTPGRPTAPCSKGRSARQPSGKKGATST